MNNMRMIFLISLSEKLRIFCFFFIFSPSSIAFSGDCHERADQACWSALAVSIILHSQSSIFNPQSSIFNPQS